MPYEIKYDTEMDCIVSRVFGEVDRKLFNAFSSDIAVASNEYGCLHVLSDARETELALSTVDIYHIPKYMLKMGINPRAKTAVVVGNNLDDWAFLETVSTNSGQFVRIFTDPGEAKRWLLGNDLLPRQN